MCLDHSQATISTFLWDNGAMISVCITEPYKRDEKNRDVNYPKQTWSALRKLVSSGVSDNMNTMIKYLHSIGFCFASSLLTFYLASIDPYFSLLLVMLQKASHSPLEFDDSRAHRYSQLRVHVVYVHVTQNRLLLHELVFNKIVRPIPSAILSKNLFHLKCSRCRCVRYWYLGKWHLDF